MTPADVVIRKFGGVMALSREISRSPSSISKWRFPRKRKGCGGLIPSRVQPLILAASNRLGLGLSPADLILGRTKRQGL